MANKKKKITELGNEYKPAIWVYVIYGVLIFALAESINWFFGLKSTQDGIIKFLQGINLDLLFEDAVYAINPDADIHEVLKSFISTGKWMWIVPYAAFSVIVGLIHANIFRLSFVFRTAVYVCLFIFIFKLIGLAAEQGVPQGFIGLPGIVTASYPGLLALIGTCFLFFAIGSETATFWRKNVTENQSFWEE